jgi:hypothetical protein
MSEFWGQFSGVVIGSLFTLAGIWLTNYFSERKAKKLRKIEILESFSQIVVKYAYLLSLVTMAEDERKYCSAVLNLIFDPSEPKTASIKKIFHDEFPRWISVLLDAAEKTAEVKSDINKQYTSYKIYFGKDEKLKELLNDFLSASIVTNLSLYPQNNDQVKIVELHTNNQKLILENIRTILEPKRKAIVDYLDEKINFLI